jgi:hypothetical protein
MKLSLWVTVNAVVFIAAGIAFAVYGPLMMAIFNLPDILGIHPMDYWNVAAFARMYGAMLFGLGLLLWALRGAVENNEIPSNTRRGIVFALVIGNVIATIVSLTQQWFPWQGIAGWIMTSVFAIFLLGYSYFLVMAPSPSNSEDKNVTPGMAEK